MNTSLGGEAASHPRRQRKRKSSRDHATARQSMSKGPCPQGTLRWKLHAQPAGAYKVDDMEAHGGSAMMRRTRESCSAERISFGKCPHADGLKDRSRSQERAQVCNGMGIEDVESAPFASHVRCAEPQRLGGDSIFIPIRFKMISAIDPNCIYGICNECMVLPAPQPKPKPKRKAAPKPKRN